jgi:type IV pilus assembly protein PilB
MIGKRESDFLELLVKKNIVSCDKIGEIKKSAESLKKTVEDFLIEKKILSLEKITELKAELSGLPYFDARSLNVEDEALNVIPLEVAENYKITCLEKDNKKIKVGLVDPYNSQALEAVNFLAQEQDLEVEYYLISEDGLNGIFTRRRNLQKEISTALESKAKEGGVSEVGDAGDAEIL